MSELERLRERVRELEAVLGLRIDLPNALGLTPIETRIVGILISREIVSGEAIFSAVYGGKPYADQPDQKVVEVHLVKIRRKLRKHGVKIKNSYGVGYYIEKADRAKLKELAAYASEFKARAYRDIPNLRDGVAA